jgi:hypothetical protein
MAGVKSLMEKGGESAGDELVAFSDHTLQRGQDCAVDYGPDGIFFGRVTEIKIPSGRSHIECFGKVSLQRRLPGVKVRCAWYEELDPSDLPASSCSSVPALALGRANPEYCK